MRRYLYPLYDIVGLYPIYPEVGTEFMLTDIL